MDRGIDVNSVNFRIFDELLETSVAFFDGKRVANLVQLLLRALADGIHLRVRMTLINRKEFRSKSQPDDGDVDLALAHE